MSKETKIEWCDSTVNPTSGCDGCELWNGSSVRLCYAGQLHEARLAKSYPSKYAPSFSGFRMIPGRMAAAANWPDLTGVPREDKPWLDGLPRHIFAGDMSDMFSRAVDFPFLMREVFDVMVSASGSRHVWMLLTKRPHRLAEFSDRCGGLPDNCIAMTSITDQSKVKKRMPALLSVKCKWRGLSCEPLRGPLSLGALHGIHLVIAGGASGASATPSHPDWFRSLRERCATHQVPFFFKQWGEWLPICFDPPGWSSSADAPDWHTGKTSSVIQIDGRFQFDFQPGAMTCIRIGKRAAGRVLDGMEYNGFPKIS